MERIGKIPSLFYSMFVLPDEAGQDWSELFIRAAEDGVDIH